MRMPPIDQMPLLLIIILLVDQFLHIGIILILRDQFFRFDSSTNAIFPLVEVKMNLQAETVKAPINLSDLSVESKGIKYKIHLPRGSLLVMGGFVGWGISHSVESCDVKKPTLSITFRKVKPKPPPKGNLISLCTWI